jgi:hypothetical protein
LTSLRALLLPDVGCASGSGMGERRYVSVKLDALQAADAELREAVT